MPALRTKEFVAKGSSCPTPSVLSMAIPQPGLVEPFTDLKLPPTTILLPSEFSSMAITSPPSVSTGFHGSSAALEAETAASLVRWAEPTLLNQPPM